MHKFSESDNNGTLYIGSKIDAPAQGTWILENKDGSVVVAKGIVRPCLTNPYTKQVEIESSCLEAAFGKELTGTGNFYPLGKIGRNRCNFAYQTALFSSYDPAALIRHDNKRFENKTALDFLSKDNAIKVKHGVPPTLLLDQIAPWDEFRRFHVNGVRAIVYGSDLVPISSAEAEPSMPKIHSIVLNGSLGKHNTPCFMLLPGSAKDLARQVGVEPHELIGRYFLIHRDPALPDGTSLYPALYCGILTWTNDNKKDEYGVILNPKDKCWKAAGGDFDGDSAACYEPAEWLLPHGSTGRPDYKVSGRKYASEFVDEQIVESAGDAVTGLLGPTIISAMCLIERGIEDLRPILAGVAQASVQAKKHCVDIEAVKSLSNIVFKTTKDASVCYPYVSSFLNAVQNASGLNDKVESWLRLVAAVEAGTWANGTETEKAITERVLIVHQLYKDIEFFRTYKEAVLPSTLRNTAKSQCTELARSEIITLSNNYRSLSMQLTDFDSYDLSSDDDKEGAKAFIADHIKSIRSQFELACITGRFPGCKVSPREAQIALLAWGPVKLAAALVPATIFQDLGINTARCILQLCDHGWNNGVYNIKDLKPIPSCKADFELFSKRLDKATVQVISQAPRSTRVMLTGG